MGNPEPGTRVLVVGGHSRNIGKTTLVVDLIRALPQAAWTAVRITQFGHSVCSIDGAVCDCAPAEHAFALDEEQDRGNRTDTSRFLVGGAARALWLRTKQGFLGEAMPLLREELRGAQNVIVESNSVLDFLDPELCLVVLDPRQPDFKKTARRFLERADAFVLRSPLEAGGWPGVPKELIEGQPCFLQPLGTPLPDLLTRFVCERFLAGSAVSTQSPQAGA